MKSLRVLRRSCNASAPGRLWLGQPARVNLLSCRIHKRRGNPFQERGRKKSSTTPSVKSALLRTCLRWVVPPFALLGRQLLQNFFVKGRDHSQRLHSDKTNRRWAGYRGCGRPRCRCRFLLTRRRLLLVLQREKRLHTHKQDGKY